MSAPDPAVTIPATVGPFHPVILPLATPAERRLELAWGLGAARLPTGVVPVLVPAEGAIDRASLADAVDAGIAAVLLAPDQVTPLPEGGAGRLRLRGERSVLCLAGDEAPAALPADDAALPVVELIARTSRACPHALARWDAGCACSPGAAWKPILRVALRRLAEDVDAAAERLARADGWALGPALLEAAAALAGPDGIDDLTRRVAGGEGTRAARAGIVLRAVIDRHAMFAAPAWGADPADPGTIAALAAAASAAAALDGATGGTSLLDGLRADLAPILSARTGEAGGRLLDRASGTAAA